VANEYPATFATDAEFVRLVRSGGKEAFAVLVGRHRRLAANLVSHVLGAGDLVNDALQEATVAALVGLDQLRSPARFGSWYAGIALNVSRRMLRERSRLASLILWSEGPVAGPDEQAEAADLSLVVRRAVAGLPPGQRSAVLAFY